MKYLITIILTLTLSNTSLYAQTNEEKGLEIIEKSIALDDGFIDSTVEGQMVLKDKSGNEIVCTLWNKEAYAAEGKFVNNPVVALKRARLSDYNGRQLSITRYVIEPQIKETRDLKVWWMNEGQYQEGLSLSNPKLKLKHCNSKLHEDSAKKSRTPDVSPSVT